MELQREREEERWWWGMRKRWSCRERKSCVELIERVQVREFSPLCGILNSSKLVFVKQPLKWCHFNNSPIFLSKQEIWKQIILIPLKKYIPLKKWFIQTHS
jgi:hypothetical protein